MFTFSGTFAEIFWNRIYVVVYIKIKVVLVFILPSIFCKSFASKNGISGKGPVKYIYSS